MVERGTTTLESYLADFCLKRGDLVDRRILDLGAGGRGFAYECQEANLARVVSLDSLDAWYDVLRMMWVARLRCTNSEAIENWLRVGRMSVAGRMERLPFSNDSFDLVLSHDALTHVFDNAEVMTEAFGEVARVLSPGGEARVFPGWFSNWTDEEKERVWAGLEKLKRRQDVRVELVGIARQFIDREVDGVMIVIRKGYNAAE